ncbi:MAG: 2-hydroxyacyl-CoA dehydratase [Chitinivibrionales bacterium]|nr:2-hydroxyacyl-CoA dehydratase [Chitinivibrionales bacterium]
MRLSDDTYRSITEAIEEFSYYQINALQQFRSDGGRTIALFCATFSRSICAGFSLWPIRLVCGATEESASESERLIRPDGCDYCKTIIGNFLQKKGLHGFVDCILGLITCDQMRRTIERLSTELALPLFPVQVPATTTKGSEAFFLGNVRSISRAISTFFQTTFDAHAVRAYEEATIHCCEIIRTLILHKTLPAPLIHALLHLTTWTRPDKLLCFLQTLVSGLPLRQNRYRLSVIVTGSVLCREDDLLLNILEENNVCAIPFQCTGFPMIDGMVYDSSVTDTELIDYLSRREFQRSICARKRPNTDLYTRLQGMIVSCHASGVILKTLSFCDLWYTEKERMRQTVAVPLLVLNSGYGSGGQNRIQTRIETFLEMLV